MQRVQARSRRVSPKLPFYRYTLLLTGAVSTCQKNIATWKLEFSGHSRGLYAYIFRFFEFFEQHFVTRIVTARISSLVSPSVVHATM